MSVRHFTRVFTAEVGETPGRFVERTRLEAARRELEETTDTLDVVAARCGLGSAETLRRVFQRHLGVPPDAYRRRFRAAPDRKDIRMTDRLQVAIPLFPQFTALDAVGPLRGPPAHPDLRHRLRRPRPGRGAQRERHARSDASTPPSRRCRRPTSSSSPAASERGHSSTTSACSTGSATPTHGTRFTTSVCTGSLVLGAAGLLEDLTATTHWSCYRELEAHGADADARRASSSTSTTRIITAAGVSSGIDMALRLVELLVDRTAAQAAQLMIEYDPQPPFDCGSVAKADDVVMTRVDRVRRAPAVARRGHEAASQGSRPV